MSAPEPLSPAEEPEVPSPPRIPRTRISSAWIGVCAASAASVVLLVFLLQNTRPVQVTFLWMHGTLPLALALLVAGVGAAILVMGIGAARITQLRRLRRAEVGRRAG